MLRRWPLATRSVVLFLALLVASTGYAVLTASTQVSRLDVRGTVEQSASEAAYDILVRPKGARLPLEEKAGLVQPGFLDSVRGGISLKQWHAIERVRGVEVAAPVALVGWIFMYVNVDIDVTSLKTTTEPVVVRRQTTWTYDNGASSVTSVPSLLSVTPNPVGIRWPNVTDPSTHVDPARWVETMPDGSERVVDFPPLSIPRTVDGGLPTYGVSSAAALGGASPLDHVKVAFPFPFLLAAVDPAAEARLTGLDTALTSGAYLPSGGASERTFTFSDGAPDPRRQIPVVVADAPSVSLAASYRIDLLRGERLRTDAGTEAFNRDLLRLGSAPGQVLTSGSIDEQAAYRTLLNAMATPTDNGEYFARTVSKVYRAGPIALVGTPQGMSVREASRNDSGWGTADLPGDFSDSLVPPGGDDTPFRELTPMVANLHQVGSALVKVGTFDAARLPGSQSAGRVPLGTFALSPVVGADAASRSTLRDRQWLPGANVRGFSSPPPLMLTSLDAAASFGDLSLWQSIVGGLPVGGEAPLSTAPLSAVRVRVSGVNGFGALDRERVRVVAEEIAATTGLEVDITLGSSPGPQVIEVPSGTHGRPTVTVSQLWTTKGVAVALLSAVDRKSQLLLVVVLATCVLVVGNAVFAGVRARRREIALVRALGWRSGQVMVQVLAPVLALAALAGALGALAAVLLRQAAGLAPAYGAAASAVPIGLVVALVAGLPPALVAARTSPVEAVVAVGARPRRPRRGAVHSLVGIAARSAAASRGRAVTAFLGVAIATAAGGVMLAIAAEFRGQAVGTLMGDAVTLQVRPVDIASIGLIALLAGFGVLHLMITELRERATEFAVMRAIGWREASVAAVVIGQAALVGVAGAAAGGGAALWFIWSVFGRLTPAVLWSTAVVALAMVVVCALAALVPALSLRRVGLSSWLAQD